MNLAEMFTFEDIATLDKKAMQKILGSVDTRVLAVSLKAAPQEVQGRRLLREVALEEVLDSELPESYDRALFSEKSRRLYELILSYSAQGLKWTA